MIAGWSSKSAVPGLIPGARTMSLPADQAARLRTGLAEVQLFSGTPRTAYNLVIVPLLQRGSAEFDSLAVYFWSRMHLVRQAPCLGVETSSILVGTAVPGSVSFQPSPKGCDMASHGETDSRCYLFHRQHVVVQPAL
jgi:hypothetical protein